MHIILGAVNAKFDDWKNVKSFNFLTPFDKENVAS